MCGKIIRSSSRWGHSTLGKSRHAGVVLQDDSGDRYQKAENASLAADKEEEEPKPKKKGKERRAK